MESTRRISGRTSKAPDRFEPEEFVPQDDVTDEDEEEDEYSDDIDDYINTGEQSDHLPFEESGVLGANPPIGRKRKTTTTSSFASTSHSMDLESEECPPKRRKTTKKKKKKKKTQDDMDDDDDEEDEQERRERQRAAMEAQRKEKEKRLKKTKQLLSNKQRDAFTRMKNLRENPRRDLISLVDISRHVLSKEERSKKFYDKVMMWEITNSSSGDKTRYPGVTNVLQDILFSDHFDEYGDSSKKISSGIVGSERPETLKLTDAIGSNIHNPSDDVCGHELSREKERSLNKCKHYGIIHGKLVHEQLSRLVHKWICNDSKFPIEYVNQQMEHNKIDPCVYKIVTLLLKLEWTPIWTEYPIYDETFCIATSIDLVCVTHGRKNLTAIEIKTSTERNAFEIFMNGTRNDERPRSMKGKFTNHVMDTGRNRAAMQLMATEAIMHNSYHTCRPHGYQIIFACSDMPEAQLLTLPEWCWQGSEGQVGLNRRIIHEMMREHGSQFRLNGAAKQMRKKHGSVNDSGPISVVQQLESSKGIGAKKTPSSSRLSRTDRMRQQALRRKKSASHLPTLTKA